MRSIFGIFLSGAVLAMALGCGKKDSTTASGGGTASLEGTYLIVEMDGETDMKGKSDEDRTITIKGDKMIKMKAGKERPVTFKTDPSKTPAHIDVIEMFGDKEAKMLGIYKMEGDTLTIFVSMSEKDEDRPKEFKSGKDDPVMTMKLKKK